MTTTPDLWRTPFLDNTSLSGNQDSGVVAATANNTFFAVWVDRTNFNSGIDTIIARSFDSLGNPLTGEVNLVPGSVLDRDEPAAVRLPIAGSNDGLAVAFTVHGGIGGSDIDVVMAGAALNSLFGQITVAAAGDTDQPSITSISNAEVWVSYTIHNSGIDSDIRAQRVVADGVGGPVGAPITIFDGPNVLADHSDLATLENGNVVAVFQTGLVNKEDVFFMIRQADGSVVVDYDR